MAISPLAAPAGAVGLWRYAPWLPVAPLPGLSLGEGATALLPAGPDLPGLHVKLEFVSPTGSFKDRGAAVLMAAAVQRGAERVVVDSSGNAGSAIAAYAARAGLRCKVFVPAGTSAGKQVQIEAYGATLERVPGDRTATMERAIAEVESTGATYASHVYDPYFFQGTKTFAFEVWEQLGTVPDAVLVPVGNGTLLLGLDRGFRELRAGGLVDRTPALIALQSERCAPLAAAYHSGEPRPVAVRAQPTAAEGIAIPRPPRGAQILNAVRENGGCVVAVPEAAIAPAGGELARRGLLVEPTAALVWAGALLARGRLADVQVSGDAWRKARTLAGRTLVVPLCGSGLKAG
jgi:threonine synthase